MYTFDDHGTSVTLRPENTASVIRAYIEHRLDQRPGVQKLYYIGPMFRRERPQKGRYRQFFQLGAEAIGSESPYVDAEVIEMVVEILTRAGLSGFTLLINSVGDAKCRPVFVEKLREALRPVASQLCGDCQRRVETNPLRVLDETVLEDQPIIEKLPSNLLDNLCETWWPHFAAVQTYLNGSRGSPMRSSPALSAASITTCAPRSKWCTAISVRRTRCSEAGVTTCLAEPRLKCSRARYRIFHRRRQTCHDRRSNSWSSSRHLHGAAR